MCGDIHKPPLAVSVFPSLHPASLSEYRKRTLEDCHVYLWEKYRTNAQPCLAVTVACAIQGVRETDSTDQTKQAAPSKP
eukprot:6212888-Pleurochrysis_carterae.AAC.2